MDTFHLCELIEIVRQQGDGRFKNCLNRIRVAILNAEDELLLKSRGMNEQNYPIEALHIFSTNAQVNAHNSRKLAALTTTHRTNPAIDKIPSVLKKTAMPSDARFTAGLLNQLCLAVGARVMLIRNLDVEDGLVNGCQRTVTGFQLSNDIVTIVNVKFDDRNVGMSHGDKAIHKWIPYPSPK